MGWINQLSALCIQQRVKNGHEHCFTVRLIAVLEHITLNKMNCLAKYGEHETKVSYRIETMH